MNRPTAAALVGCFIALLVYVSLTSLSLFRDLNASRNPETLAAERVLESTDQTSGLRIVPQVIKDNRGETKEAQVRAIHRHRLHVVAHGSKQHVRQEPITLL
ncbi:MAG TPA: hypothetical protein VJX67_02390 [Blastocatellia bacterium]|nr:hypothetical protein [Blastocatellia bacterium]